MVTAANLGPFVRLERGLIINLSYIVTIVPADKEPGDSKTLCDKIEIRDCPNRYIYCTRKDLEHVIDAINGVTTIK